MGTLLTVNLGKKCLVQILHYLCECLVWERFSSFIRSQEKCLDVLKSIGNNIVENRYIRLNKNEICFSYSSEKRTTY